MKEIIENLVKVSNELDEKNLSKIADSIDKIASEVSLIKIAQFVGVQGYWIRNSRCWGNCYRQKRATKKNLSAQQVWEECHKEYVASINDDNSGWEKYADEVDSFIKTASLKQKKYISQEAKDFHYKLEEKIASGMNVGDAFVSVTEDGIGKYSERILKASADLLEIAKDIKDNELSEKVSKLSIDLVKEAQFGGLMNRMWSKVRGGFQGASGKRKSWIKDLENQVMKVLNSGDGKQFLDLQRMVQSKIGQLNQLFAEPAFEGLRQSVSAFVSSSPGNRTASARILLKALRASSVEIDKIDQQKASQPNQGQNAQQPQNQGQKPPAIPPFDALRSLVGNPATKANAIKGINQYLTTIQLANSNREIKTAQQQFNQGDFKPQTAPASGNLNVSDAKSEAVYKQIAEALENAVKSGTSPDMLRVRLEKEMGLKVSPKASSPSAPSTPPATPPATPATPATPSAPATPATATPAAATPAAATPAAADPKATISEMAKNDPSGFEAFMKTLGYAKVPAAPAAPAAPAHRRGRPPRRQVGINPTSTDAAYASVSKNYFILK